MLTLDLCRTGFFSDQSEIQSKQESIFICSQDVVGKYLFARRLSHNV